MSRSLPLFFIVERRRAKKRKPTGTFAYKKHKEEARELIHARLEYWNQFYNFKYNGVRIKNSRTRWGSCSKKGNLNFNFRLALIAPELLDYVVVHELCHLKEFNHGPEFWVVVAETIPDYVAKRKALRRIRI